MRIPSIFALEMLLLFVVIVIVITLRCSWLGYAKFFELANTKISTNVNVCAEPLAISRRKNVHLVCAIGVCDQVVGILTSK